MLDARDNNGNDIMFKVLVNGNPIQYQEQKQAGKAGVGKLRPVSISYLTSISS